MVSMGVDTVWLSVINKRRRNEYRYKYAGISMYMFHSSSDSVHKK